MKAARRQQVELSGDVPSASRNAVLSVTFDGKIIIFFFLFINETKYYNTLRYLYIILLFCLEPGSDNDDNSDHDGLEPDTYYDNIEIDEEEEETLKMFMSTKPEKTRTLADIIRDKITDKHTELQTEYSDVETLKLQNIDPR